MDMIDALRIIVAKSPNAASQAMTTIAALGNNSPMAQQRYNMVVQIALNDPSANFTDAERAVLAENLDITGNSQRTFMLRVRLTETERAELQKLADESGQTMSDYARAKLFVS